MSNIKKWGLFSGEVKMKEYKYHEYEQALEDLKFVYEETGIPHQLKLI